MEARLVYLVIALVDGLSRTVTFTTSTIYRVDVVGLDALQLLLVGTTLEMIVFLFEVPTGVVADVFSRRLSVIIGMALIGVGFMVEGLSPVFWVVLLSQVVWGLGWAFFSGAQTAWLSDEIGVENVGATLLRGGQMLLLGGLVGIPLAVALAGHSLALPFFVGGGLRVLLAFFLIIAMPETGFTRARMEERENWTNLFSTVREGIKLVRGETVLLWFMLIALFVGLYSEGWDRLNHAHLLTNHSFPDVFGQPMDAVRWFGVLSVSSILFGLLANEIAQRMVNTSNRRVLARVLQSLYGGMVLAMVGFALVGNFWLVVGFFLLFSALRGVTYPLSEAFVNQYVDSKVRATVLSVLGQIDAFGQVAGGPLVGFVGRLVSIPVAILTSAGILTPTVALFGALLRADRQQQAEKDREVVA